MSTRLAILLLALILDRLIGDPDWLWRRVKHPVVLFGAVIGLADRLFNRGSAERRRAAGILSIIALLWLAMVAGIALHGVLRPFGLAGMAVEAAVAAVFLAQKSLADHVAAVAAGLRAGGLDGGRKAVAMIVGRNPQTLDRAGVSRAAIESLAENASDGVIAPAFWYALLGLPGLLAYKMLNTADSMIGHRNERHRDFGWASARLDDFANLVPARLTGLLFAAAAWTMQGAVAAWSAVSAMLRDAPMHRSPNAGWPEAALAAAIGVTLSGPRLYGDAVANEPWLNAAGRREADAVDIDAALALFWRAMTVFAVATGVTAVVIA